MGCHGLDVLVNNSGRGYVIPALDADMEEARKVFDVNFWGVLAVTQAFSPLLLEAKGTILNIGSVVGECPGPLRSTSFPPRAVTMHVSQSREKRREVDRLRREEERKRSVRVY